ncbi:hypothetical protein GCM10010261_61700 [Streptomyces pilosus]|uniref:hypothetical protein n=1 Tax=Streptomyces pilosus TaxID=28893 RepID=UPI00167227D9|nr:hypothetical protein [Streptomyces pilosus]GGV68188.1 hypothetical protein GCM10010261_61700 [Streptomyces pilosus]
MHLIHVRLSARDFASPSSMSDGEGQLAGTAAQRPAVPEGLLRALREQASGVCAVEHVSVAVDESGECVVGLFVTDVSVTAAESVAQTVVERALARLVPAVDLQVASSRATLVPRLLTRRLEGEGSGRSMPWPDQSTSDHWS